MEQMKSSFVVAVKVNDKEAFLYMPLPSEAFSLMRWTHGAEQRAKHDAPHDPDADYDELLKTNGVMAAYSEAINGRVIAALWDRERNEDLAAFAEKYDTPEKFGAAVYRDLYRAGWHVQEIGALFECAVEILLKAGGQMVDGGKVDRQVNFSGVLGGATTTSGSAAA